MLRPYYKSSDHAFNLLCGDSFELLPQFNFKFDMIFADPPYFLSSGGISVQSGKVVCVDKGRLGQKYVAGGNECLQYKMALALPGETER